MTDGPSSAVRGARAPRGGGGHDLEPLTRDRWAVLRCQGRKASPRRRRSRSTGERSDSLPDLRDSSGAVAACDFDRDGDLDLFVGGRQVPGSYPEQPVSRLLENRGGRLVAVEDRRAPGLARTGMVTGALWSDVDDDGWLDLLLTHEWGPVKLWRNRDGELVDATVEAGLSERSGWWNGIAGGDVDGDGDIDYAVTNFGLNSKYNASAESPQRIYWGDFEGRGVRRIVEVGFEGETLYPVRGKSCSQQAMPGLRERFPTFAGFAGASFQDIYGAALPGDTVTLEADTLESGLLLNDGAGRFRFEALPRTAQASAGFGVALVDVDADGHLDLYLAQNFYGPQRETGRIDGGVSLLLLGRGAGDFVPAAPHQSGLVVPDDAKGLGVTDLDADGWPDFVVGVNDGEVLAFENAGLSGSRWLRVRLVGPAGNPTAIGARVVVRSDDGTRQVAEVYAGGSYLSQSSSELFFGMGSERRAEELEIRWPDGKVSRRAVTAERLVICQGDPGPAGCG